MRSNERHGFTSIPKRLRKRSVSWRPTISKRNENLSHKLVDPLLAQRRQVPGRGCV